MAEKKVELNAENLDGVAGGGLGEVKVGVDGGGCIQPFIKKDIPKDKDFFKEIPNNDKQKNFKEAPKSDGGSKKDNKIPTIEF